MYSISFTYFSPFPLDLILVIAESARAVLEHDLTMLLLAATYRVRQTSFWGEVHSVAAVVASSQALSNPSDEVHTT